jgi:hypothetical protein
MTTQQIERIQTGARNVAIYLACVAFFIYFLISAQGCSGGTHAAEAAALLPPAPVAAAPADTTPVTPCPIGETGVYPNCTPSDVTTNPPPATPPPICSTGGTWPNCTQPAPPAPSCPAGQTVQGGGEYCCPDGDTFNGNVCVAPPVSPPTTGPVVPPPPPTSPVVIPPNPTAAPPTMTLIAAPNPIAAGASAVLTWSSTNAGACYGTAGWPSSDVVTPNGFTATGALMAVTSYELVCNGAGGNATASVTVNVMAAVVPPVVPPTPPDPPPVTPPPVTPPPVTPPPPVVPPPVACALPFCMVFTPTIINADGAVFFTWSSTALACDVSGAGGPSQPAQDFGTQGGSGTTPAVQLVGAAVWTLTCDMGGAPYQSTSVTVSP